MVEIKSAERLLSLNEDIKQGELWRNFKEQPKWMELTEVLKKYISRYRKRMNWLNSDQSMIRWKQSPNQHSNIQQAIYIPLGERDRAGAVMQGCINELFKVIDHPDIMMRKGQRAKRQKEELEFQTKESKKKETNL